LIAVLLLGTLGFSTVGTLLATMTGQTRARESLLPIVMMPVTLPVLLPAVYATLGILGSARTDEWLTWTQMLAVIDFVYLILCYLLFEYVIED
jgi:heme exporter protein B